MLPYETEALLMLHEPIRDALRAPGTAALITHPAGAATPGAAAHVAWPLVALRASRAHDVGRAGWFGVGPRVFEHDETLVRWVDGALETLVRTSTHAGTPLLTVERAGDKYVVVEHGKPRAVVDATELEYRMFSKIARPWRDLPAAAPAAVPWALVAAAVRDLAAHLERVWRPAQLDGAWRIVATTHPASAMQCARRPEWPTLFVNGNAARGVALVGFALGARVVTLDLSPACVVAGTWCLFDGPRTHMCREHPFAHVGADGADLRWVLPPAAAVPRIAAAPAGGADGAGDAGDAPDDEVD